MADMYDLAGNSVNGHGQAHREERPQELGVPFVFTFD
jgi:hypothetical protein